MALTIADLSEFQPDVDWDAYAAENPAAIVRVHNGRRADHEWAKNRQGVTRCRWWAGYFYLPASIDAAAAARSFLDTLGAARPNATILDIEEGAGDQLFRQHDALNVLASDPAADWTYSGYYFARDHNLDPVEWVAAYGQREPTTAHLLWQFTNSRTFAGVGQADGSIFHGSIDELLALTNPTPGATPPALPPPPEDDMAHAYFVQHEGAKSTDPVFLASTTIDPIPVDNFDVARVVAFCTGVTVHPVPDLASKGKATRAGKDEVTWLLDGAGAKYFHL